MLLAFGRLLQAARGHEGALPSEHRDGQPWVCEARPGAVRWEAERHSTRLQHLHTQSEAAGRGK